MKRPPMTMHSTSTSAPFEALKFLKKEGGIYQKHSKFLPTTRSLFWKQKMGRMHKNGFNVCRWLKHIVRYTDILIFTIFTPLFEAFLPSSKIMYLFCHYRTGKRLKFAKTGIRGQLGSVKSSWTNSVANESSSP